MTRMATGTRCGQKATPERPGSADSSIAPSILQRDHELRRMNGSRQALDEDAPFTVMNGIESRAIFSMRFTSPAPERSCIATAPRRAA